jgi:hypothetical protein
MTNQHRATPEQWEYQERWASDDDDASCILELRCRVEALEATQHAHADVSRLSDAEREQVTQELAKPVRMFTAKEVAPIVAPATRARFISEVFQAASAEVRPAAKEIFPVEYADSNGEGIRIIMEPADETGRVCWVVRNSRRVSPIREFPTPEAAYAAHQACAELEADCG